MHYASGRKLSMQVSLMLAALACLTGTAHANTPAPSLPGEEVTAIWRTQRIEFRHTSFKVAYSCDALLNKMAAILSAVGVWQDARMNIRCSRGAVGSASAEITLASPVEATPANVEAATTFDGRAELVAHLRHTQLPTATDIERFQASWRTVSLWRDPHLRLTADDCELVRGMHDQILSTLSIRVTKGHLHCSPFATSLKPTFEVAALVPAAVDSVAFVADERR
jgi:hypothetical protein